MARARLIHAVAFLLLAGVLLALAAAPGQGADAMPLALVAGCIALLGVPHGALDPLLAQRAGLLRRGLATFMLGYLGAAALVCVVWWLAPTAALAGFLLMSIRHFAGDWRGRLRPWQALAAASSVIAAPVLFHPGSVTAHFAALVPDAAAAGLVDWLRAPSVAALALLLPACLRAARERPVDAAELAALPSLAWAFEPLTFFVIYFCGLHSPRHLIEVLGTDAFDPKPVVLTILGTTAITLLGAAGAWLSVMHVEFSERLLRVTFIGLAALTLPHMWLTARYDARRAGSTHPIAATGPP